MKADRQSDRNFDDIAGKFNQNIYGTNKGKLRHEMLKLHLSKYLPLESCSILDAGGGTGKMTLDLALLGHKMTLADISGESLSIAQQNISNQPNIPHKVNFIQQSLHDFEDKEIYDFTLCHAVLEWLEQPFEAIKRLLSVTKKGGYCSISFFNLDAQRFGNMLYGNFDYVAAELKQRNRVRLTPNQPLVPKDVIGYIEELDVSIELSAGIRCFHDYLKEPHKGEDNFQQLLELELRYAQQEPYKWLGKYFQLILRKNG